MEREDTDVQRRKQAVDRQDAGVRRRDRSAKNRVLLGGGADTSGTELDHALWWKRDVSLYRWTQDVHVVYKALPKDVQRQPAESQVDSQSGRASDVR